MKSGSLGLQGRFAAVVGPGAHGPGAIPGRPCGPSPAGAPPGLSRLRPCRPRSHATGRCPGRAGSCRGFPTSTRAGSGAPVPPAAQVRRPGLRPSSLCGSAGRSRESSPAPAFRRPGHDGWHGGWLESAVRAVARERAGRGCPSVRGTGYTGNGYNGVSRHCRVSCSGIRGARRLHRLAFSIALHPVVTGCALHTTFGGRWLLVPAIAYWFTFKKRVKVEGNRVMGWVAKWGVQ